jgi:hypothetical protein
MCRFSTASDTEYLKVAAAIERVLANVSHNSSEADETKSGDAEDQIHIDSLRFDQLDARLATIKSAYAKTCKWLLENPAYLKWLAPEQRNEHNGFLWIKGKAGSGESNMLKYILSQAKKNKPEAAILSFFFHPQGDELEKSTIGMYRLLLLQLFERIPRLQCALDVVPLPHLSPSGNIKGRWQLDALRTLFQEAVKRTTAERLICFIDALDECHKDEVRDLVTCFETLCQEATDTRT